MPLTALQKVPYSQFLTALDNKNVAEAQIGEAEINWKTKDGLSMISAGLPGMDDSEFNRQLR